MSKQTVTPTLTASKVKPPKLNEKALAKLSSTVPAVIEHAKSLVTINSDADLQLAVDFRSQTIRPALKQIDDLCDENISLAHQLHKSLLASKKQAAEPWLKADELLAQAGQKYRREVEQQRLAEQRRIEAEMQARAEELAAEEALELLNAGDEVGALALLGQIDEGTVEVLELPPMLARPVKIEGLTVRKLPRFRVVDVGKIPRQYMVPDMAAIQKVVNEHGKKAESYVPGIEFYFLNSEAVRS